MPNANGFRTLQEVIDEAVAEFDRADTNWLKEAFEDEPGIPIYVRFSQDVRLGLNAFGIRNTYFEIEPYTRDELAEAWRAKIAELKRTRTITMLREVQ